MVVKRKDRLKKELTLFHVYAIAAGTTLSAGFFLLPGLAAVEAGAALPLAYLIAVIPLIPAMLSIIELGTAMPRAGGVYYFLDRTMGPMVGTIGGFGTWAALVLKVSFALIGMGAYINLFFPTCGNCSSGNINCFCAWNAKYFWIEAKWKVAGCINYYASYFYSLFLLAVEFRK